MDNSIKLIERYKDIKFLYKTSKTNDPNDLMLGLYNLKSFKEKNDNKNHLILLQTCNPDFMPNIASNINVFFKKYHHQIDRDDFVGFYKLVPLKDVLVGDMIHVAFKSESRYDEAPFEVIRMNEYETELKVVIEGTQYKKLTFEADQWKKILSKSDEYFKYEKLDDDWFENELNEWLTELKNQ